MYRVVFYCPDTHIEYDGWTPYVRGVGGGVTSRVRMARALAKRGHDVVMVANCPNHDCIEGVDYLPVREVGVIDADVVIMNSSGGEFDLTPVLDLDMRAQLKILWVSGKARPKGVESLSYDFLYAKSNFLRDVIEHEWLAPANQIFVAYNGFDEDLFLCAEREGLTRDPFRLIYAAHPAKGIDSAISILRKLRAVEPKFHMVVCGGPMLWGQNEEISINETAVEYLGLIGQKILAKELFKSSFSINLQGIEEGFGMLITESMRAGCVVVASYVGAYPELIRNGIDGFLFKGDHLSEDVCKRAADQILSLCRDPSMMSSIQAHAMEVAWTSELMASVWTGHWDWFLANESGATPKRNLEFSGFCHNCGDDLLRFADGDHCITCGRYHWVH